MPSLPRRARWPTLLVFIVGTLSSSLSVAAPALAQTAAQAKAHLQAASAAARASRWDDALNEYRAAQAASPSIAAATGIAEALDALRQNVPAYDAFRALIDTYGPQLSRAARGNAEARLSALGQVTGVFLIKVNIPDASVSVDGVVVGTSPISAPVRVATGLHRVRATKAGYDDAEALPTVAGGASVSLDLALKETQRAGHIAIRSNDGKPATLFIDGVERGTLPWDGELEAGPHEVYAHSKTLQSPHQTVEVVRGQTQTISLQVNLILGTMSIATADRKGSISVDGKVVGDGSFDGQVPVGAHRVHVERDGYDAVDKQVVLHEGESYAETFTLTPAKAGAPKRGSHAFEGFIGGVMVAGAFQVNSMNGDFSEPCTFASTASAVSCSAGSPAGGALMGYVGYTADPFGVDFLFGGQLDTASVSMSVQQGSGQPTNSQSFTVPRIGGFFAPRARITGQLQRFRFTFAAGVGLAIREVSLSTDGISGLFSSQPTSAYVAPAITLAGQIHFRATDTIAIGAGLMYWAESAGDGVQLLNGTLLKQPAYVVSAAQTFVLPYIGLEFGP